jgi:hypothetical protein
MALMTRHPNGFPWEHQAIHHPHCSRDWISNLNLQPSRAVAVRSSACAEDDNGVNTINNVILPLWGESQQRNRL